MSNASRRRRGHEHGGDPGGGRRSGVLAAGETGVAEAAADAVRGLLLPALGAVSVDTVCVTNLADSRAVLGRRVVGGGVAVACCLLGAVSVDTLCVANLADSRAVLGHRVVGGGVAVADPFSAEHSAAFEEVRRELAALHPDDGQIVLHIRGQWRVKGIIQAV